MNVPPLVTVKAKKIFTLVIDGRAFCQKKGHEDPYKGQPKNAYEKESIDQIFPTVFIHGSPPLKSIYIF